MSCLIITPQIKELASHFPNEKEASILNLVGLWQERNNKSLEDLPSVKELQSFISTLRNNKERSEDNKEDNKKLEAFRTPLITLEEQQKVDLLFDPKTRRDRVTLISRLFSNELDTVLKEKKEDIQLKLQKANNLEKVDLEDELNGLDRIKIIKSETPKNIFDRVANIFQTYLNLSEEVRINKELQEINALDEDNQYTQEEKLEAAKKKAAHKYIEYQKIVEDKEVFRALAEEATLQLAFTEGIIVDYVSPIATESEFLETEDSEEAEEGENKEEVVKDGWMTNFREVSSHESLSTNVRKVINNIPKLDYEGYWEEDDLGNNRYLEPEKVHATLIESLKDMVTSKDMIPLLQKLQRTKPWVEQIIDLLQNDEVLFSQFYQDFRKDFNSYWIQKYKLNGDETYSSETININKPEGIYNLINSWRDNYETGTLLDAESIYTKDGKINIDNVEKGLKAIEVLTNIFNNKDTEERLQQLEDPKIWRNLMKVINMAGMDINPSTLRDALHNIKSAENIEFVDPIITLLTQLNVIYNGLKTQKTNIENGKKDLINTFSGAYSNIATLISEVSDEEIESSVTETIGGKVKTFYSFTNPNYLGKLIKQLKNVSGDKKTFEQYLQEEFKQYEWFYKDGHWKNDWLRQLEESEELRKGLAHKVLLSSDRVAYPEWDASGYTRTLITEYFSSKDTKSNIKYAWYYVSILSDSPSAEFIKFRRYTNDSVLDKQGRKRSYQDVILDKLEDLVNQEYDRIMLVRQRDIEYQNGNKQVEPIANFDIIRTTDGKIKSIGGAEFKFLPALNNLTYENGESFLDVLSRLKSQDVGPEFRQFLRDTLEYIMEETFEEEYKQWNEIGLFTEVNGKYKYLPFSSQSKTNQDLVNTLKEIRGTFKEEFTPYMESLISTLQKNDPYNSKELEIILTQLQELIESKAQEGIIDERKAYNLKKRLQFQNPAKTALREYFWNSTLATSQIIQLTTTDLAFYKDLKDFQKRYKEVHSPSLRLNTQATYKGEKVGREIERTIYLKDEEIVSPSIQDIEEVLDTKVEKGELTKADKAYILSQFKKVNVADAQAYRSLSSYRAMLVMSGQWTDAMENAYHNLQEGKWSIEDFSIIWQTKKPFVYTQVNNVSGIEGHTGIKTPVQHKNSEFLLLALYNSIAGPLYNSDKLKAINKFMEEYQIDVVQFESTTKVGKQGVIDLNDVHSMQEVTQRLKAATGISTGTENPNVVHKIPYEDYGIQVMTPEHLLDAIQLIGSQIKKLITADIPEDAILEVNGKKLSKKEWLDLYNSVLVENILQSYKEVYSIFKDKKEVERVLQEELRSNTRYGMDMIKACTLDENGNFNLPLFDPIQSIKIQQLLNSIIKNRITKQKIKGGALIQVSNYGLTNDLHIVFEGEGKEKRIKYLECYMPAYSREFYEPLMDPETHTLDVSKLPDDLRKLIGYRVPTEDKYSMVPLFIKGFLPQQNGSAIMLPAEITTLSGSDFDVDKLYVMLPEFKIQQYDMRQAKIDYAKEDIVFKELMSQFSGNDTADNLLEEESPSFKEWFSLNKEKYKLKEPIIQKEQYDFNKKPQENTLKQRNNLVIDLMEAVLTNADTTAKIINPGGPAYQKRAARIVDIFRNTTEGELKEALSNMGVNKDTYSNVVDIVLQLDIDTLSKLAEATQKELNPLSPTTQVALHQQNMTGAKMISIYAVHNANHAFMQHTKLQVSDALGGFILNGKKLLSLHNTQNADKEFISRNNAGFVAASVDNVKDPILASLNQNSFTASATMLLSRLGYNPIEIGILMNQPIILDMTRTYLRDRTQGKDANAVVEELLNKYQEKAGIIGELSYDAYKGEPFPISILAHNLMVANTLQSVDSNEYKIAFYKKQLAIGYLFQRILNTSNALDSIMQASKYDTVNNAAGPTIADSEIKISNVKTLLTTIATDSKFPLENADVISDFIKAENLESAEKINALREELLKSSLPMLQASYTLGVQESSNLLKSYFPQFTAPFREVIDALKEYTKSGRLDAKTMNNIYNDLLAYIMSKTAFFGAELSLNPNSEIDKENISAREKRDNFINNFPLYFNKTIAENEDIAELEFIKRLKVVKSTNSMPILVFRNVGKLSPILKERYMRDWTSLLYMSNPKAQELALNLFRYSFFRNGFAFGPNSFIHLAPVALRKVVPDYIETLRSITTESDDYSQFVEQYIYNHLDNRQLVTSISTDTSIKFEDEENAIKDKLIIRSEELKNPEDKKFIKKINFSQDGPGIIFNTFISTKVKGKSVYYKLTDNLSNEATYTRIEPLGLSKNFIEYEYGKDVEEMETVIKSNKDSNSKKEVETEATFATEESNTDIGNAPESFEYTNESDMEDLGLIEDLIAQTYGGIETETKESKVKDIEPNYGFTDENNQPICGA